MDAQQNTSKKDFSPLAIITQWHNKSDFTAAWHGSNWHQKLLNITPKVLKPTLALIPFSWQKKLIVPILHKVFAEALEEELFACLEEQWLKLSITDLDLHWLFSIKDNQFIIQAANKQSESDVSFSANGNDLLLIAARHEDPDTLFFQRRLLIEGNTALGLEIKNLIDSIDTSELPNLFNQTLQTSAKWLAPVSV